MTDRLLLILAALGLVPVALSYGVMPSASVTYLMGFPVDGINHTHVFRAIMGLYLANAAFWLCAAVTPHLRRPALWVLFLFMAGLERFGGWYTGRRTTVISFRRIVFRGSGIWMLTQE